MDHRTTDDASAASGHPAAPMLDLQQFCSTEQFRIMLHKPFSRGAFSYASDGIIAIRVPRRDDIPQATDAKVPETLDRWFEDIKNTAPESAALPLPGEEEVETKKECEMCDGRGKDHECPSCECVCDECDGRGKITVTEKISIDAFGSIFRLTYLRRILQLPNIEIAVDRVRPLQPMLFRFTGGEGCLMPCSRKLKRHINIEPQQDSQIT